MVREQTAHAPALRVVDEDVSGVTKKTPPTSGQVIRACAEYFGISVDVLRSRRTLVPTKARLVALYLCRVRLGMSYPEIGRLFKRHHTTALDAFRRVEGSLLRVDANEVLARLDSTPRVVEHCEHCGQVIEKDKIASELRAQLRQIEKRLDALVRSSS